MSMWMPNGGRLGAERRQRSFLSGPIGHHEGSSLPACRGRVRGEWIGPGLLCSALPDPKPGTLGG